MTLKFLIEFEDQTTFSSDDGYWDDCPKKKIQSLKGILPFSIKKRNDDGSIQELDPSSVELSGFEQYYCASRARNKMAFSGDNTLQDSEYLGLALAGINKKKDAVLYVEIDTKGNVVNKLYTLKDFNKAFNIAEQSLK